MPLDGTGFNTDSDQVLSTLIGARDYLRKYGWRRGNLGGHGGERCLVGAIYSALGTVGIAPSDQTRNIALITIKLLAVNAGVGTKDPLDLARWNDRQQQSAVMDLLDMTIQRHQAEVSYAV